jgi:hypothetical protein
MNIRVLVLTMVIFLFAVATSIAFAGPLHASLFSKLLSATKPNASGNPNQIAPETPPLPAQPIDSSLGLVTLSFDDGSKTQYINGWPIMQKYEFRGTFYITTGNLDGFWYMTPQMVRTLYKSGNHIGAHTINHKNLTTISSDEVDNQLKQPQEFLERLLDTEIKDFATPFGAVNPSILTQIKKYYRSHRGITEGLNGMSIQNAYTLLVRNVYDTTSADQVKSWLDQTKKQKLWLILVYHEIKDNPDHWSTTPQAFEAQLEVIKESKIPVVTLDQALSEFLR